MDLSLEPRDLFRILRYRKWWFFTPAALVLIVSVLLILFLPPVYRSQATILIEDQDIPEDIVPTLLDDYIDRRLDTLTRRVLLTDNLRQIINSYDLYLDKREFMPMTDVAEHMRDNITVNVLSTQINDPTTGRTGEATVAFEIQFDYGNPRSAQQVTNELVSLFLSLNMESRRQVVEQTTNFLSAERSRIESQITEIEQDLAAFQLENRDLLPEAIAFKRQLLSNVDQQIQILERDYRSLREREGFLTTELALTDEFEPLDDRVPVGSTPESQLEVVRAELATARARYSESHPDVMRLRREVASLEEVVGARSRVGTGQLAAREEALVAELAGLRKRYTATHPDVVRVENELASLRDAIANAGGRNGVQSGGVVRNTAFVQLSAQLNSVQAELHSIEEQREQLLDERRTLQEQIARAPVVEQRYLQLNRRLEEALADRESLADKEAMASLSGSMEIEAIGERLVLAEPPDMPLEAVSPPEKLILGLGLVLAMVGGTGAAAIAEVLDRSVRTSRMLAQLLGDTPLATVPTLVTAAERRRRWGLRLVAVLLASGVLVGVAVYVHQSIVPLEVLGFQTLGLVDQWISLRGLSR